MVDAPVKPRWTAIELEETQFLNNAPEVERLWTVYMFDRNSITRICSQDKHYLLSPLYVNVEFKGGVSEGDQDRIQGELTCEMGDPDYHLECDIEDLIEKGKARIVEFGELGEDEDENTVREEWQGNCPL